MAVQSLKIAIDVRAAQTPHRMRGIGRYVVDLVRALAESGADHEFGLMHLSSQPFPSALTGLAPKFVRVPVQADMIHHSARSWVMRLPRARSRHEAEVVDDWLMRRRHRRALERAVRAFDPAVVHIAAPIDAYTVTSGRFGRRRTVATFFDAIPRMDAVRYYDTMPPLLRQHYDRQFGEFSRADAVVAISLSSREEALHYAGTHPARTFAVHLAVSDEFSQPTDQTSDDVAGGRRYFLFLSALDPHKNYEGVVRAFAFARVDEALVMVSANAGPGYERVMTLAKECGVAEHVVVTGFVADDKLRAIVQHALALVAPSFYEGFGLPAAQAMRAGVPVIVSNRTSQPEVVGDAGIQVDPDDIAGLANAMRRIAADEALRTELGTRGAARAALFSYRRLARNMCDVYEGRAPSDPVPGLAAAR